MGCAAPAAAETFCVPAHAGCTGTSEATVDAALTAATANNNPATVDRIEIAAGTYTGTPNFSYNDAEPLDIVGAGSGQTILTGPASGAYFLVNLAAGTATVDVRISNLSVVVPAGAGSGSGGIFSRALTTIEDTAVTTDPSVASGFGVSLQGTSAAIRRSTITSESTTSGQGVKVHPAHGTLVLEDSTVTGDTAISAGSGAGTLTVRRSTVAATTAAITTPAVATLESTLVRLLGTPSVGVAVGSSSTGNAGASADHLTIVGPGSAGTTAVRVISANANAASLGVSSSIMRGAAHAYQRTASSTGNADLTIAHSMYDPAGSLSSGPGTLTESPGNLNQDPLFAGATDFHLSAGSPAIDAGTTPDAGSTGDRDGNARVTDGTGDGIAISDMGAYEFPAAPVTPGPAPGGPLVTLPGPAVIAPAADVLAPVASLLRSARFAFPAAPSGASVARRVTGTTIRYRLSEAARVAFTVRRERAGRRVGLLCRPPTRANRLRPRCRRYVALRGSFTHAGRAGANAFRFTGRLAGRKLAPGLYRLVARPTDAAGNRGAARTLRFRIVP
jgi:hypothetical protein